MSSGHHHPGGGGQSVHAFERLIKDEDVSKAFWRPYTINRDYDIPYLGGTSSPFGIIYIDRHLPEQVSYEVDGKLKEFDPTPFICEHERFERALMDALKWGYEHAHWGATSWERRQVMRAGLLWTPYKKALSPYIKGTEKEKLKKVPANLDMRPYKAKPVNTALISTMESAMKRRK